MGEIYHRSSQDPEVLIQSNIANFFDQEACYYATADVAQFHLAPGDAHHSGLFDGFSKITFFGDHGSHFGGVIT